MQKLAEKAKAVRPRVIFSGIQPTGVPHLGNYVGALRQWVQLQHQEPRETKLIYSIVDLHAITMPQPPDQLRRCKREALAALLAIGIDPGRATIFHQSSVRLPNTQLVGWLVGWYLMFPLTHDTRCRSRRTRSSCGFSAAPRLLDISPG